MRRRIGEAVPHPYFLVTIAEKMLSRRRKVFADLPRRPWFRWNSIPVFLIPDLKNGLIHSIVSLMTEPWLPTAAKAGTASTKVGSASVEQEKR